MYMENFEFICESILFVMSTLNFDPNKITLDFLYISLFKLFISTIQFYIFLRLLWVGQNFISSYISILQQVPSLLCTISIKNLYTLNIPNVFNILLFIYIFYVCRCLLLL